MKDLVDTAELADELGLHPTTLAEWRMISGRGPAFIKVGAKVRYRRADIEAWLDSRTRVGTRIDDHARD